MRPALPLVVLLACRCEPQGVDSPGDSPGDSAAPVYDEVQVSEPSTALDPDYQTLLTVSWEQGAPALIWVEYSVDDGVWMSSPPLEVEAGPVSQLLLGLPYSSQASFRIANDFGEGALYSAEHAAVTGEPHEHFPEPTVLVSDSAAWDPEMPYLFTSLAGTNRHYMFTTIIDRQGRAVWARLNSVGTTTLHPRVSWDGSQLLVDEGSFWSIFDGGASSRVLRMHIDGTVAETVQTPGLHHPFTDMPDGSIAWAAHDDGNETIVVRAPDGSTTTLFDCFVFLEPIGASWEWCGSNTLWYDPDEDRFLYSLYSEETVVEIDRASGEATRWFGHLDGAWGFASSDTAFWWQHGAHFTEQGHLLVSAEVVEDGSETVVREYALDADAQLLEQVWSFGEGQGVFADTLGEAHRLPGGNILHNYGSGSRLREVTPEGEVVWDIDWDVESVGRSTPVADLWALMP